MNDHGVASFIELIWPLPGETLESFKQGVQSLCTMGAQSFGIYPLLWLPNVGFSGREEELGIVTLKEADPAGGGQVVVQTNEVTHLDWLKGLVFTNAVMWLYDCRGLFHTLGLLNAIGIDQYRTVFDRFVNWMETECSKSEPAKLWKLGQDNFIRFNLTIFLFFRWSATS